VSKEFYMGGEVKMIPAIPDALRGKSISPDIYAKDLEAEKTHGWGSENLPQLAAALALCNAVNTNDPLAIESWKNWWTARFEWERKNFMGIEMAGRTYPSWHFMPKRIVFDIAIRMGWFFLASEAYSWMLAFVTLAAFASGKSPGRSIRDHRIAIAGVQVGDGSFVKWSGNYCAWAGDRADSRMSANDAKKNNVPTGTWYDWLSISTPTIWLNLSLKNPVDDCQEKDVERGCQVPSWLLEVDKNVLNNILAGDYSVGLDNLRVWCPQVPIRVCQTTEGVWTVCPVGRGSSTPHLYACSQWHNSGIVNGLYADPGWRDAGKGEEWISPGRAWVDENRVVVCERSDGKYGSPHRMILPGGIDLLDFTWGPDGVDVRFPPQPITPVEVVPPVISPNPQPPRKDKWWEFL